jgi:hypothetical protein
MFAISATPVRVYNSVEKKPEAAPRHKPSRHWRQCAADPLRRQAENDHQKICELQQKIVNYETANKKMKMLAGWNLRATKSALKDIQDIIEVLEDIYGDKAYDDSVIDKV